MTPRIANPHQLAPAGIKAMMALEASFAASGLDPVLIELVKLRASQINGCAYCIHMHTTDLRKRGEPEMRLYMLDAWHESSLYSERERAALGWTEALTRLAETRAPDAAYDALNAVFTQEEQVQLTLLIGAINTWNRLQVGFRIVHPVDPVRAAA
jgi:AhpD family alkylhydroperoxidase